jgi:hypothetical protein
MLEMVSRADKTELSPCKPDKSSRSLATFISTISVKFQKLQSVQAKFRLLHRNGMREHVPTNKGLGTNVQYKSVLIHERDN